jgi:outer membrane lipase/esterase
MATSSAGKHSLIDIWRGQGMFEGFVSGRTLKPSAFLMALGISSAAHADLADVAGLTETQRNTAVAVQTVCTQLPTVANRNGLEQDLLDRCRNLRQTAGTLGFGSPGAPVFPFSLQVDTPALATAIQSVAPEEFAARQKLAIEAAGRGQAAVVRGRLGALRAATGGAALNEFDLSVDGKTYTAESVFGEAQRGGGASADTAAGGDGRLGVYGNAAFNRGDKSRTEREDGFDFDSVRLIGGVDYRFGERWVGGLALGYERSNVDFEQNLGAIDSNSYGGTLYGSFNLDRLYVDARLGYSHHDYDTKRNIFFPNNNPNNIALTGNLNRTATGSSKANQYSAGLGAGYGFNFGKLSFTPYGRLDYINLRVDALDESGAQGLDLHTDRQTIKSLQSALGGQISYAISTRFGVLQPQAGVEWNHEFQNKSTSIAARYVNDPFNNTFFVPTENPDRDYYTITLGISGQFKNGLLAFINYENVQGLAHITNQGITLGVRKEW